jgi:hypothetical protein
VLRDLGAPSFRAVNSAARLSEIFSNLRAQRLDLSQLAVLEPQLTTPPQLDARGLLRIEGIFPSTRQVTFSLVFKSVAGQWRLFGVFAEHRPAGAVVGAVCSRRCVSSSRTESSLRFHSPCTGSRSSSRRAATAASP